MPPLIKIGVRFPWDGQAVFSVGGRNSAVECQLPKLDVAGSIPVARSIFIFFRPWKSDCLEKPFFSLQSVRQCVRKRENHRRVLMSGLKPTFFF